MIIRPIIYLFLTASLLFISCEKEEEILVEEAIPPIVEDKTATYRVTFSFDWNKNDFPTDYPAGAHFSPLVGWVHQVDNTFFDSGKIATAGIEQMAETGATGVLVAELNAEISNGKGLKVYTGSGLSGGVGTITIDVDVSPQFPAVSLVTMIAPSPDWYAACVDVNLLDENNVFVTNKTVVGRVYDAGTDNGASFTSTNSDTNPKVAISKITQPPLGNGTEVKPSFCTVSFEKILNVKF
ncbi:MAG: Uncharacterised protein [Bacteroidota bacterium]|nr:MAG: Uncharacterised protein [Bacteroidota bacterium]